MKAQTSLRKDERLSAWISKGRDRYLGAEADRAAVEAAERLAKTRPIAGNSSALRAKFGA